MLVYFLNALSGYIMIDYLCHQISDILPKDKTQVPNLTRAERQAIKELRDDNSIVPAEKGKAKVIMNTADIHDLVNNILQYPITESKIMKNPTAKLLCQHKEFLKQLKDNFEIRQVYYNKLSINHPKSPYARQSVKIHKDPPESRLLVCSRHIFFYNTAQHHTTSLAPIGKTADVFISDSLGQIYGLPMGTHSPLS